MNQLQELRTKRSSKLQQYNVTPTTSWKKELFKLELSLIDGKIALEEFKQKNK